jgi:flagellar hook protein FlgE
MRNHQVALDVTGNNIANVNTAGFKAGRVTFKESMAQLLQGASRPPGFQGGTNPVQLGLGMAVGSIDTMLTQGNLESTGQITDLAIEGRAYFAYGTGEARYYSRMGALQFDANGTMVSPTNGFALQGKMANEDGTFTGQPIGDIRIPFGDKSPAQATGNVSFGCNLDSDSEGLGTVAYTQRFLAAADDTAVVGADDVSLTSLYDSNGNDLGIRVGDILTMTATTGVGAIYTRTMTVLDPATGAYSGGGWVGTSANSSIVNYQDLASELQALINVAGMSPGANAAVQADGSILIDNIAGTGTINNFQITSSRPGGSSGYISSAFSFPSTMTNGALTDFWNSDTMRRSARTTDLIDDLYDANGNALGSGGNGIENTATIYINGAVGGETINQGTYTYATATSTLQDLVDQIRGSFGLPLYDGTPANNSSVSVNVADTDNDNIPDGAIVIRGQPESAFAITNVSVQSGDPDPSNTSTPTRFNANIGFVELQRARDTAIHQTSIVVYDESGDSHTMTTTFTRTRTPGRWLWEITTSGGEQITGGNQGVITFAQDGSPSSFTFDDNASYFSFDPMNGSNEARIQLDVGSPGSFRGITQFRSPSTTAAKTQDGYTMGKLQQISINEYGTVSGVFTNGITKDLAQIYIAEFNNPGGLMKMGDSMYRPSANTGEAILGIPKVSSASSIKPGALELSNVELATEFTSMITTQRGFQANARVITVSDQMLQELVQLVR